MLDRSGEISNLQRDVIQLNSAVMGCLSCCLYRCCFEISPLLSNIVKDYPIAAVSTNPVGRNDVYGKRHVRENFRTLRTCTPKRFLTYFTKSHHDPVICDRVMVGLFCYTTGKIGILYFPYSEYDDFACGYRLLRFLKFLRLLRFLKCANRCYRHLAHLKILRTLRTIRTLRYPRYLSNLSNLRILRNL